jgi:hypothetical protein
LGGMPGIVCRNWDIFIKFSVFLPSAHIRLYWGAREATNEGRIFVKDMWPFLRGTIKACRMGGE